MVFWFKKNEPENNYSLGQILLFAWLILILISKFKNNNQSNYFSLMIKGDKEKKENSFDNVIGLESVKEEIRYYIDLIKNKDSFKEWNVKLPKGILLAGPPGTGKTLLVKTIAKSLNVPVISCSGSSFVEIYVGVGAKRIRELFQKAREYKNCIIFIDEIDAIGGKRGMNNNSERASTLNQLLVEMDGFNDETGIIVFAATNLVKNLDSALLRSGRFDKKIYFDLPNFFERKKLFELYFKDIEIPKRLSYDVLSDRSAGITGADIANIANQSKMNAIQSNKKNVCLSETDIQVAIDEVMIGREKRERMLTAEEKRRVAHHEAGHALMGYILKDSEPPIKVSIIPRGESALGFSQSKPENKMLHVKEAILTKICVLLGGRCAEKIFYSNFSTGAADDIEKISHLVEMYFTSWGMSEDIGALNPKYMGVIGENISNNIFKKCKNMVDLLEKFTIEQLTKNKKYVKKLAKSLLQNETIVYKEIKKILPDKLENSLDVDIEMKN